MSHAEYDHHQSEQEYRRKVTIGQDGRVYLPSIRFLLALGCNLRCGYCPYAFQKGIVSKEKLIDSFEKWSRKVLPGCIRLYGGEPLLNPDIAEIVIAAKRYWSQAQYQIVTNGILLPRLPDTTLGFFSENNVHFHISQHLDTQEYRDILKQSLPRLDQWRIRYVVEESLLAWHKTFDLDTSGVPMPCHSNPEIAYRHCTAKHCTLVHGDCLYKCAELVSKIIAVQNETLGPEWSHRVLTHKPVTFESSPQEICAYLHSGPIPECSICPETRESVEPWQLSMEEFRQIQQRNQKTA